MVVDERHDHSFRVPRPDLSETLGTPQRLHRLPPRRRRRAGRRRRVDRWYGAARRAALALRRCAVTRDATARPDAARAARARGRAIPACRRSPAPRRSSCSPRISGRRSCPRCASSLRDPDPLVRRAAAETGRRARSGRARGAGGPAARDPMRTVRLSALGSLLDVPASGLSAAQRADLARVVAEYRTAQASNADRAEARVNLGMLERPARQPRRRAQRPSTPPIRLQPRVRAGLRQPRRAAAAVGRRDRGGGDAAPRRRRTSPRPPSCTTPSASRWSARSASRRRCPSSRARRRARAGHAALRLRLRHRPARQRPAAARHPGAEGTAQRRPGSPEVLTALVQYEAEAGNRDAVLVWARKLYDATGDPQVKALIEQVAGQERRVAPES